MTKAQHMQFGQLHHVELYISNLKDSLSFWNWFFEYLEYDLFQEWSEGRSYKKDATYVVLVQTSPNFIERGYHRKNTGLNHLAFWGKSKQQLNDFRQILIERGIILLYDDKYPHASGANYYALYFEDPFDRIKIELVAPDD